PRVLVAQPLPQLRILLAQHLCGALGIRERGEQRGHVGGVFFFEGEEFFAVLGEGSVAAKGGVEVAAKGVGGVPITVAPQIPKRLRNARRRSRRGALRRMHVPLSVSPLPPLPPLSIPVSISAPAGSSKRRALHQIVTTTATPFTIAMPQRTRMGPTAGVRGERPAPPPRPITPQLRSRGIPPRLRNSPPSLRKRHPRQRPRMALTIRMALRIEPNLPSALVEADAEAPPTPPPPLKAALNALTVLGPRSSTFGPGPAPSPEPGLRLPSLSLSSGAQPPLLPPPLAYADKLLPGLSPPLPLSLAAIPPSLPAERRGDTSRSWTLMLRFLILAITPDPAPGPVPVPDKEEGDRAARVKGAEATDPEAERDPPGGDAAEAAEIEEGLKADGLSPPPRSETRREGVRSLVFSRSLSRSRSRSLSRR
ncbi:hypothetical protein CVT26_008862, partial [Gymnopilus dilepis]